MHAEVTHQNAFLSPQIEENNDGIYLILNGLLPFYVHGSILSSIYTLYIYIYIYTPLYTHFVTKKYNYVKVIRKIPLFSI